MSGAVVRVAPNLDTSKPVQVTFRKPIPGDVIIMDSYFQGYNIDFSIDKVETNPSHIKEPLLSVPTFIERL